MSDEWAYAAGETEDVEDPKELADPGEEVPELADDDQGGSDA